VVLRGEAALKLVPLKESLKPAFGLLMATGLDDDGVELIVVCDEQSLKSLYKVTSA
jgi:hypothetical protein